MRTKKYSSVITANSAPEDNPDALPLHIALVKQAIRNKLRRREFTATHRVLSSLKPESRRLHAAAVAHMQFSPDGNYLATCGFVLPSIKKSVLLLIYHATVLTEQVLYWMLRCFWFIVFWHQVS